MRLGSACATRSNERLVARAELDVRGKRSGASERGIQSDDTQVEPGPDLLASTVEAVDYCSALCARGGGPSARDETIPPLGAYSGR